MKQLSGPYNAFEQYYPLEDAIELYNEIWYESSSSDEWVGECTLKKEGLANLEARAWQLIETWQKMIDDRREEKEKALIITVVC